MSGSELDPDIKEVFAELGRQDAALEESLGLEPLEPLEPIAPPPPLAPLPGPDASADEWQKYQEAEDANAKKGPSQAELERSFEDSLVRMKKTLDVSSGSPAVDAANRRVYAAHLAMFENMKAGPERDPMDFVSSSAVFRESHDAFSAAWLARLEYLRTTCSVDLQPKVDKAIAWQQAQNEKMRQLQEKSDRAMAELKHLRQRS